MSLRRIRRSAAVAALVIVAAVAAIALHAIVPAAAPEEIFDSLLVRTLGFPFVASLYFILLFAHCSASTLRFSRRSAASPARTGAALGAGFALLYMVGMQEVVVEASPFASWGREFVAYQAYMGFADALPALLLCLALGRFFMAPVPAASPAAAPDGAVRAAPFLSPLPYFTLVVGAARTAGNLSGGIASDLARYPSQTVVWNFALGAAFGLAYAMIRPLHAGGARKLVRDLALIYGLNWAIFNAFIGLIFAGVMGQMLLRSAIDTAAMAGAALLYEAWGSGARRAIRRL